MRPAARLARAGLVAVALVPILAACTVRGRSVPMCDNESALALMAQSVPSAALVPCIDRLPVGWSYGGGRIGSGRSEFWLYSHVGGEHAVTVSLAGRCERRGGVEVRPARDEAGTRRFDGAYSIHPRLRDTRAYVFRGGCVTYRFAFDPASLPQDAEAADRMLTFAPRPPAASAATGGT